LERLQRDVLSQPGVRAVVLFLGTNDLFFGASASQVITGMQQAISQVHAAGLPIYGVTLLSRAGSDGWEYPGREAARQQVNAWIRSSGQFDGIIDFAAVVRDVYDGQCQPDVMYPPYDSGDHLHPNAAGQTAMADAVPTTDFGMPQAPPVALLLHPTPTAGCPAAAQTAAVLAAGLAPPPVVPTSAPPTTPAPSAAPGPRVSRPSNAVPVVVIGALGGTAVLGSGCLVAAARRRAIRRRARRQRRRRLA
jgi:hypothetical protein